MSGSESSVETSASIPSQLAFLVPSFDPSKDDLQVYQQKVQLVLAVWPSSKVSELITRLILNTTGSAFAKLQLHHEELCVNDSKGVKKLIELLGGHWGKIGLELKYADAERALFQCTQKADESHDSYLARADILWTKLRTQKLQLDDLQAYITLRGSLLTSDDKKRVILESDASLDGKLTINRVGEAIRLLGTSFFQEMTGISKTSKTKVYDHANVTMDDIEHTGDPDDTYVSQHEDFPEDEVIEALAAEGDEDASFVADFEAAASDLIQSDPDLSSAFTAYTDARRKLSEKVRFRGFWPVQKGQGKSKGFKGGKGKSKQSWSGRKTLQQRILESNCRLCGRRGHWKNDCPLKGQATSNATASAPVTFSLGASDIPENEVMPMEFLNLTEVSEPSTKDSEVAISICLVQSKGVVVEVVFRFGNQGTLKSEQAMVVPIGNLGLKVAVVPGATPFLLSNTLLRALDAMVDTASNMLIIPKHGTKVDLQLSPKGLYLLNLNELIEACQPINSASRVAETFAQDSLDQHRGTNESAVPSEAKCRDLESQESSDHAQPSQLIEFRSVRSLRTFRSPQLNLTLLIVMSEWAQRLKKIQAAAPAEKEESIDHLTLEDLKVEKMSFGKAHIGRPFLEVWNTSPEWTQWFLQHYAGSSKLAHRKMIKFIKLMIEETENKLEDGQKPVAPQSLTTPKTMGPQPKSKAMAAPSAAAEGPMSSNGTPWVNTEDPSSVHHLEARMLNMENALQQILNHLAPGPIETFPTMPIEEEWDDDIWNN
eukprot:s1817_g13.t1